MQWWCRGAVQADAQSLRAAVLLDELDFPGKLKATEPFKCIQKHTVRRAIPYIILHMYIHINIMYYTLLQHHLHTPIYLCWMMLSLSRLCYARSNTQLNMSVLVYCANHWQQSLVPPDQQVFREACTHSRLWGARPKNRSHCGGDAHPPLSGPAQVQLLQKGAGPSYCPAQRTAVSCSYTVFM